jgi:tetratricopeptide (TPR) repeat protein
MIKTPLRLLSAALLVGGLLFNVSPDGSIGFAAAQAQSVRAEVAKPLKAAGDLIHAGKYKEALAKVHEADAVGGKTPGEQLLIEQMRGSAALGARDYDTAARAFEKVMDSGKLSAAEKARIAASLASAEYSAGHYAKAIQWAKQAGGSGEMHELILNAMFQMKDYGAVIKELAPQISADEKAGRKPSERDLGMLVTAYQSTNNSAGVSSTLEKLLANYPKKETWAGVLSRLPRKPGFSGRFTLDLYRLQIATGNMTKGDDYMEAAQLALEQFPAEGKKIVEKGFATGLLGTGPQADRQKRLRDLAAKREADFNASLTKDIEAAEKSPSGDDLVKVGYELVTLGQYDKGIDMMQRGITKDDLKRPEDAKLHLGMALLQAGKKAKAIQTLKSVQGNDGASDIARLWIVYANQGGQIS